MISGEKETRFRLLALRARRGAALRRGRQPSQGRDVRRGLPLSLGRRRDANKRGRSTDDPSHQENKREALVVAARARPPPNTRTPHRAVARGVETRSFPVRFGLLTVGTIRTVRGSSEHYPSSSRDTVSTTLFKSTEFSTELSSRGGKRVVEGDADALERRLPRDLAHGPEDQSVVLHLHPQRGQHLIRRKRKKKSTLAMSSVSSSNPSPRGEIRASPTRRASWPSSLSRPF